MAMTCLNNRKNDSFIFSTIDELVPSDHKVRELEEAIAYDFVNLDTVFGDGTHRKANANNRKHENKVVEIVKTYYDDELLEEINKDREEHGKKSIKASKTDPESGCFHKGEKQKCFAYTNLTFFDRHGFVLHNTVAPGNQHDSVVFHDAYRKLLNIYGDVRHNISLDAGFVTPAICREIIEDGIRQYLPYKRPMTKKR